MIEQRGNNNMGITGLNELKWLNEILEQSPPVVLCLGLLFVGYFIKKSPLNTYWILAILPILGALTYPLIAELSKFRSDVKSPIVLLSIHGFLIGVGAVGANTIFRKVIERFFPMKNGNTERLVKEHERQKRQNPDYKREIETEQRRRDDDYNNSDDSGGY